MQIVVVLPTVGPVAFAELARTLDELLPLVEWLGQEAAPAVR